MTLDTLLHAIDAHRVYCSANYRDGYIVVRLWDGPCDCPRPKRRPQSVPDALLERVLGYSRNGAASFAYAVRPLDCPDLSVRILGLSDLGKARLARVSGAA